jgi:hypothetical protein
MNILDEFRWEARTSYEWLEAIVREVTPEQAVWRPPGRANSIAATYTHIVRNQDEDVRRSFLHVPMLAETTFRGKTGHPEAHGGEWAPDARFDWAALRAYGSAVGAWLIEAVDALSEEDLVKAADISTPDIPAWRGLDVVRLSVGHHVRLHGGEIACLKGLQDMKGYRTGQDVDR